MSGGETVKIIRGVLCALALSALFTILIFGAQALGSTQPTPEGLQALHLTECQLPCWIGIVPGQTKFEDAVRQMRAIYPEIEFRVSTACAVYQVNGNSGQACVSANGGEIINAMNLYPPFGIPLLLGDVVGLLGNPACGFSRNRNILFVNYYAEMGVAYLIPAGRSWRAPLNNIEIHDKAESAADPCFP